LNQIISIEENNREALQEKLRIVRKLKDVKEKAISSLEQKTLPSDFATLAKELKNYRITDISELDSLNITDVFNIVVNNKIKETQVNELKNMFYENTDEVKNKNKNKKLERNKIESDEEDDYISKPSKFKNDSRIFKYKGDNDLQQYKNSAKSETKEENDRTVNKIVN